MHQNILNVWDTATSAEVQQGETWYARAHEICANNAERFGVTVEQAVGAFAAISPMLSWERNISCAESLLANGTAPCLKKNVRKGILILEGVDPLDVLGGRKVRSFYHNILLPDTSYEVTIDRHAFDVAVGCTTDDRTRKALNRVGMYDQFRRLYRDAARELGCLPHQVQAVTWLAWKRTKDYASNHATLYQTDERLAAAAMV